jgi:signal peptidase I
MPTASDISEAPKCHRPWVGLLLSFLVTGSAQFFAGQRRTGVAWFLAIWLLQLTVVVCLASKQVPGVVPSAVVALVALGLWIVMLTKSWRPIPRISACGWAVFIPLVVILPIASGLVSGAFVHPFHIPTNSMAPTLLGQTIRPDGTKSSGDHLFCERYAYWFNKPRRGDVIVFETAGITPLPPGQFFAMRVVGLPNDVLAVRNGKLLNHGKPVEEPAALSRLVISNYPMALPVTHLSADGDSFVVPSESYFVVGDNTVNSFDSRYWGPVPEKSIIGRISKIYWPLSRAGTVE